MKKLFVTILAVLALAPLPSTAQMVNDFDCHLSKGYTVEQLFAFRQEWMAAAKKQGFDDASYSTRIYFPLYSEEMTTEPLFFRWRGQFNDGKTLGKILDWFPTSEWVHRFSQIMNCQKGSLWIAAQE